MSVHVGGRGPGHLVRTGGAFYPTATTALDFQLQQYRNGAGTYSVRDPTLLTGWSGTPNLSASGMTVNGAGDVVSLGSFTFPAVGSVYCEYVTPTQPAVVRRYPYFVSDGGLARFCLRGAEATDPVPDMVLGDGASNISLLPITAITGLLVKTVLSYDTTLARVGFCANGTDATAAKQASAATLTGATLYLGSDGGTGYLTAAIRRFVIYPTFMTPAQRIAMTS